MGDWLSAVLGVAVTDVVVDGLDGVAGSAVDASAAEGVGTDFDACPGVVGAGGTDVTGVARLASGVGVRLDVAIVVGVGVSGLAADGSRVGVGVLVREGSAVGMVTLGSPDLDGSAVGMVTLGSPDLDGSAVGMVTLGSPDRVGVGSPGPSPPVPHPAEAPSAIRTAITATRVAPIRMALPSVSTSHDHEP